MNVHELQSKPSQIPTEYPYKPMWRQVQFQGTTPLTIQEPVGRHQNPARIKNFGDIWLGDGLTYSASSVS